mmetsp:Transcript_50604/g.83268  ORF Transcript_50604/g.83268 Transcript_50604/m.83268 type:complete len:469 (+) Transcript_50604:2106-3512(+)
MSRLFYSPLSSSPYTSAPQAGVTGGNATRRGEKRAEEASSGTKGTTNERRGWERILLLLVFTVFYELLEDKIRSFKVLMIICFLVSRSAGRSFGPSLVPRRVRLAAVPWPLLGSCLALPSATSLSSRPFVTLRYGTGPLASLVGHSLCSLPSSLRSSFVPLVLGPSSRRACDSGSSSPRPARVNGRRFLHTSLHLGFRHSVHTALPSASPGTGPRATRLIIPSPGSVFLRPVSRLLASLVTRFVPHSRYSLCSSYRRAVPSLGLRPSLPHPPTPFTPFSPHPLPSGPRSFLRLSLGARRKEFCPGSLPRSTVGSLAPRLPPSPPSPHVPFGLSPCRAGPGQRGPGRLHSPHSPRAFAGPPSEPAHLAHFVPSVILTPFGLRSYRSAPHFGRFLHSLPASFVHSLARSLATPCPSLAYGSCVSDSRLLRSSCRSLGSFPHPTPTSATLRNVKRRRDKVGVDGEVRNSRD